MENLDRARMSMVNSIIPQRKSVGKRGRYPRIILDALEILAPCRGYENGIPVGDLAKKLYGENNHYTKSKTRQIVAQIRRRWEIYIYSYKPLGVVNQRRYCHLQEVHEFNKIIEDYNKKSKSMLRWKEIVKEGKKNKAQINRNAKKLEEVIG